MTLEPSGENEELVGDQYADCTAELQRALDAGKLVVIRPGDRLAISGLIIGGDRRQDFDAVEGT